MKNQKIAEIDLEITLERFFNGEDSTFKVRRQVYYGGKRIDLIIYTHDKSSAIEVKLSDWRGALKQASLNKTACEDSYVAIWRKRASGAIDNLQEFVARNVGLIVVDDKEDPFFLYKPRTNSAFLPRAKAAIDMGSVV